jgi:hypothetical protein
VLQANPGVLAAAPATIAVAQHWAGSGDTGKTLDAAARAAVAAGELDMHEVEADMWDRVITLWDGVAVLPGLERYNEREIRRFRRWAVGQVDNERFLQLLDEDLKRAEDPSTRACLELSVTTQNSAALGGSAGPGDRAGLEQRARSGPRDIVLAVFLSNLGEALLQEGEVVAAPALLEESITILRERGDIGSAVRLIAGLALVQASDGMAEEAITELEKLLDDPSLDRPYVHRWVGYSMVLLHQLVGDARAADATFDIVASTLDTRLDWPTYERQLNVIMRSWLDTGRWEHARNTYYELRPNWAGHVVMSDLHAARLELMSRGQVADPEFWRRLPDQKPDHNGVDQVSASLIAAQVCGAEGDLARMRELLATPWEQIHPKSSDHALLGFMWTAVRDFTRIEVTQRCTAPPARIGPPPRHTLPRSPTTRAECNETARSATPGRPNSKPSSPGSAVTTPSSTCSSWQSNDGRPSNTASTRRYAGLISPRRSPVAANAPSPAPMLKRHWTPLACWALHHSNNAPSRCWNGSARPSAPTACSPDVNARSSP